MITYNQTTKINNKITAFSKTKTISPEITNFPDQTMLIIAPEIVETYKDLKATGINIVWKYQNEKELLTLYYITSNLKERYPNLSFTLKLPYLPNARMDRTHESKEVFTLKYFCNIINSLGFDRVEILDVHSNVGAALINNVIIETPDKYIRKMLEETNFDPQTDYIFFPDEGSCKRYSSLSSIKECKNIGFGIKNRDWATGKILGINIFGESPKDKRVYIIDDICSYGGTVYYSSEKLKEAGCKDIFAFFSHCEDSIAQGKLFNCERITKIFTTDSICSLNPTEYSKLTKYEIR